MFPADNVWNTPIASLPVDAHSAQWLASMDASSTDLHPDYGPSGDPRAPYGIPFTVVAATTAFTHVTFDYASESDRGPYPLTAHTPIEGGSDRHALMVDPSASRTSPRCTLFETYDTRYRPGGRSTAGSGAIWTLTSNALRPATWTSADAAGLAILPGLVNYDEVRSGAMDHAIRFTAECTSQAYLWPARHEAGQPDPRCPPMGARFRLRAGFHLPHSQCGPFCQTVLRTMKTYGMILADNGSNWYFQGTADTRWTYTQVDQHVLPLFHVHGLFVAAYCSLSSGASMRWLERFDVTEVLAALATSTLLMGVPTHYTRLLADPRLTRESVAAMRLFVSGSAPLLASTHASFLARTGQAILERYGMTETGMIASNPLLGERRPSTVGFALPGVEVRVPGSPAVVQVRGPNVFAGYWGRPELRDSEFTPDGFFITGDLGVVDADGYLEIVGRSKDVVISGGLNVYPREVELVLDEVEGVVESAVVGVPDDDLGEVVAAALVVEGDFDEVAVLAHVRETLAPFKVPRRFLVVNELPRNAMGKVQKALVRARVLAQDVGSPGAEP